MDPILYERRRRRSVPSRKRRWGIALILVLGLLLAGGIAYFFIASPVFRVERIVVDDRYEYARDGLGGVSIMRPLTSEEKDLLRDRLAAYLFRSRRFRALGERSFFAWPSGNTSEEFRRDFAPYAESVAIEKNLFTHEVRLIVLRRQLVGAWCFRSPPAGSSTEDGGPDHGDCYWIDRNGTPARQTSHTEGNLLLNVQDFSKKHSEGRPVLILPQVGTFIGILTILNEAHLGIRSFILRDAALEEIETNPQIVSLPQFRFSLRADPEFLRKGIEELKKVGLEKLAVVDFRVPNRVYYKIR